MKIIVKVAIGIAAFIIFLGIVGAIVFIVTIPASQQNTNNNSPIATLAPTPTIPSVNLKFSLWYTSGTALPVESANPVNSGSGYYIITNPLEFIYEPTHAESYTFDIRNEGNVPIKVTAIVLTQGVPANTNVFLSNFYIGPEQTPSTQDSVTVQVGQSTTVTFTTTLTPNNPPTTTYMQGLSGATYNFKLELSSTQAS